MRILVDLDSVVADTLPAWLDRIHYHYGVKATIEDIKEWNLHACHPLSALKPGQIFDVLNEKGFNLTIPPVAGALDNIRLLIEDGHDVSIVTARFGDNCLPETYQWMKEHMPWFDAIKKLWFCYDKNRITGDIFIDDRAETLIKYSAEWPDVHLITIDYPYNQHAPHDTIRVARDNQSWDVIRNHINSLSKR